MVDIIWISADGEGSGGSSGLYWEVRERAMGSLVHSGRTGRDVAGKVDLEAGAHAAEGEQFEPIDGPRPLDEHPHDEGFAGPACLVRLGIALDQKARESVG